MSEVDKTPTQPTSKTVTVEEALAWLREPPGGSGIEEGIALLIEQLSARSTVETSGDEWTLRRLLAAAYSGFERLYTDDGELQDSSEIPVIDYVRDPVSVIEQKIQERGLRKLASAQNGPADSGKL